MACEDSVLRGVFRSTVARVLLRDQRAVNFVSDKTLANVTRWETLAK